MPSLTETFAEVVNAGLLTEATQRETAAVFQRTLEGLSELQRCFSNNFRLNGLSPKLNKIREDLRRLSDESLDRFTNGERY